MPGDREGKSQYRLQTPLILHAQEGVAPNQQSCTPTYHAGQGLGSWHDCCTLEGLSRDGLRRQKLPNIFSRQKTVERHNKNKFVMFRVPGCAHQDVVVGHQDDLSLLGQCLSKSLVWPTHPQNRRWHGARRSMKEISMQAGKQQRMVDGNHERMTAGCKINKSLKK